MKNLRQAYIDHLASGATRLSYCLRIVRTDGTVYRYTDHDEPLKMLDTGKGYSPQDNVSLDSAMTSNSDGEPDKIDLVGALTPMGVNRDEIAAGLFDYAKLYVFRTIWDDPHDDDEELGAGFFGSTTLEDNRFTAEFRSISQLLDQDVGRVITPTCDTRFGSSRCKVRLTPDSWQANTAYTERKAHQAETGSVVSPSTENGAQFKCVTAGTSGASEPAWDAVPGNTTTDGGVTWKAIRAKTQTDTVANVTSTAIFTGQLGFPDDWFGTGTVRFTSGQNAGISREVKVYLSDQYTLWKQVPYPVAVGDTFVATAGCRKRFQQDCQNKHENHYNFQGAPHVPGEHAINKYGGQ